MKNINLSIPSIQFLHKFPWHLNDTFYDNAVTNRREFWLSLFAVFFAWFVAFPASIIILDFDLAIIPERLVYSPGYQRAWTFNPTNPTSFESTLQFDQYLLGPRFISSIKEALFSKSIVNTAKLTILPVAYMQTFNKVLIIPPITKSKFIVCGR